MIMHLSELEISKTLKRWDLSGPAIMNLLKRKGWTPLGYGVEAGVAEHPQKAYVLKIFPKTSKYDHFVSMVKAHPENPHFPRFSRYVRDIPGTEFSYVRMEKLSKVKEYDLVQIPQLLCLLTKLYRSLGSMPPTWVGNNVTWDPKDEHRVYCGELNITPAEQQVINLLYDVIQADQDITLDLHSGNFMKRGTEWVITDPFV